jgi:hypothetical protein
VESRTIGDEVQGPLLSFHRRCRLVVSFLDAHPQFDDRIPHGVGTNQPRIAISSDGDAGPHGGGAAANSSTRSDEDGVHINMKTAAVVKQLNSNATQRCKNGATTAMLVSIHPRIAFGMLTSTLSPALVQSQFIAQSTPGCPAGFDCVGQQLQKFVGPARTTIDCMGVNAGRFAGFTCERGTANNLQECQSGFHCPMRAESYECPEGCSSHFGTTTPIRQSNTRCVALCACRVACSRWPSAACLVITS